MKRLMLSLFVVFLFPSLIFAHPGRTDRNGCHVCQSNCAKWNVEKGVKHCHNGNEGTLLKVGNWYGGGTLHKKTAGDWHSASYRNRLATSADFVTATTPKNKQRKLFEGNLRLLKTRSVTLEKCISEATRGPKLTSLKVSEIAATCIILLKFQ